MTLEHGQAQIETGALATPVSPSPQSPTVDRLAYVPVEALPLLLSPSADEQAARESSDAENQEPMWSADIHPEPAAPAKRVLFQAPVPSAPLQAYTLLGRLADISPAAQKRLAEKFAAANATWPPAQVSLIAIKDEKALELFARQNGGAWIFIHRYDVLAASGGAGPKLRQGDRQVPEGVYGISFLNPNSRYHVSLRVNYPNSFDRLMAAKDGRKDLGGDIMIHGKNSSAGCLAIGDDAAEELFVLVAQAGLANVKLIIAPTDFRRSGMPKVEPGQPVWLPQLYSEVASAMAEFKPPAKTSLLSFFGN